MSCKLCRSDVDRRCFPGSAQIDTCLAGCVDGVPERSEQLYLDVLVLSARPRVKGEILRENEAFYTQYESGLRYSCNPTRFTHADSAPLFWSALVIVTSSYWSFFLRARLSWPSFEL
jgi:hypothetical protein